MTYKPAIVIVAFNRIQSLQRLLKGIRTANYDVRDIPLLISIDFALDNQDVLDLANEFTWPYGNKEVIYQNKNLGLRKHILKCGAYAITFESVIILEDDLYVSPSFYSFACAALEFSEDKTYIAGVSLYSHQYNVHSRSNFSPLDDGYDNWYFQFASSWGQAWTKRQWLSFYSWYVAQEVLQPHPSLPENVTRWSEKSWLKYFIAYLVEKDIYFLYPRTSYTTNFSDMGTHVGKDTTTFQVPLDYSNNKQYRFSSLKNSDSVYDAFYENRKLHVYLNLKDSELVTDLYGKKANQHNLRFILTEKILPFKILQSFSRSLKPHDANIVEQISGDDLFLYDSQIKEFNSIKPNVYRKIIYNIKSLNQREANHIFFQRIKDNLSRVKNKIGL